MPHQNSVFHALLKHVPWNAFEALVEKHGSDRGVRRLSSRSQFVALLYGQLGGASSLREIEAALQSHERQLYHLGAARPLRSTLADANAGRPAGLFCDLFAYMIGALSSRGQRCQFREAVRLIDATGVRLAGAGSGWAHSYGDVFGVKLHLVYDPDADMPLYAAIGPSRVREIVEARAMPVEAGATYVFDLGYYDYAWWAKLDAAGCRIVTRLKTNTPLAVSEERPIAAGSALLWDRVGSLPRRLARSRSNPLARAVREIGVRIETGKVLRVFTNDLDAPAETIAALYKRRWAIELFFRWIKQTLKIRCFLGRSENAVRIQIAVALIAFLLLKLAAEALKLPCSPLTFARLVRINLMHRRDLATLRDPAPPPRPDARQLSLGEAYA